ncbi:MAG TPA: TetR/AcrR family transcriptional regulator [Acidimicrobiales bacterium]|nr:TetR/AcrR family transcriptional regulator [Acidimicrobiales bacterium]
MQRRSLIGRVIDARGNVSQTQQLRKAETRGRLLAAAATLFAEQGIDAVSVDAVAEAAGRTSGAVYDHFGSKQGLLLALLDSWKDSLLTVLLAEVAVSDSADGQLAAVWENVAGSPGDQSSGWSLLEHELWLRAARDPSVAGVLRRRDAEARRENARRLAGWTAAVDARPSVGADELAVLVKALLTGLAMQRSLDPASVSDRAALAGLAALVGLPQNSRGPERPHPSTSNPSSVHPHTRNRSGAQP